MGEPTRSNPNEPVLQAIDELRATIESRIKEISDTVASTAFSARIQALMAHDLAGALFEVTQDERAAVIRAYNERRERTAALLERDDLGELYRRASALSEKNRIGPRPVMIDPPPKAQPARVTKRDT